MLYVELKLLYLANFSSSFLKGLHYYLDMVKKNKINSTRPNKMKANTNSDALSHCGLLSKDEKPNTK